MWKKIIITAAGVAAVVGTGTAAVAATGSSSTPATKAPTLQKPAHKKAAAQQLRGAIHGSWVSENRKTKTFVTHDVIRGTVTAESPTSITVKAADGVSETFVVNAKTKVRVGKTTGAISAAKVGAKVGVVGTGTSTLTATRVVVAQKK